MEVSSGEESWAQQQRRSRTPPRVSWEASVDEEEARRALRRPGKGAPPGKKGKGAGEKGAKGKSKKGKRPVVLKPRK